MPLKQQIINLVPRRLKLAARFNYNRMLGRLDNEIDIIQDIVRARRGCLDVGANVGLYTYRLAQLFDAVEAFEPIPRCAQVIASSGYKNVRVHNMALSDRAGSADLSMPATGRPEATAYASLSHRFPDAEVLTVALRTIDSFAFTRLDLIKIDVEGHELAVLEGALDTIRREEPTLLVEIEQRHHPERGVGHVFDFIATLGYLGSFLQNGTLVPLREFSVEQHQRADDLGSSCYINNFIFRPQSHRGPETCLVA